LGFGSVFELGFGFCSGFDLGFSWGSLFLLKVLFFGFWVLWDVVLSGVFCGLVLRKSTSLKPELGWEVDKPREEAKEATSDWRRLMSSTFFEGLSEFDFAIVNLSTLLLRTLGFGNGALSLEDLEAFSLFLGLEEVDVLYVFGGLVGI
jgi:hypothetical protein